MQIFSPTTAKTEKSIKLGYLNLIIYFEPDAITCPWATMGCMASCLANSGRLRVGDAKQYKSMRLDLWRNMPELFLKMLLMELLSWNKIAIKRRLKIALRANGTSDDYKLVKNIQSLCIKYDITNIIFYDYTKNPKPQTRVENVHYTYSVNENTTDEMFEENIQAGPVSVVFRKHLPKTYKGYPVVNGDKHDLTFLYGRKKVIGLKAKGRAMYDQTGFVVDVAEGE